MTMTLAIHGGAPVISSPFEKYSSLGRGEEAAAIRVMRSGVLSGYVGAPGDSFMGGPEVRRFRLKVANLLEVPHAVAVNSLTSGLIAAVGAIGVEPGDEIITSPWTMSATAAAILHWNAIPVFADIDRATFNIDPQSVRRLVTPRTRAILAVDIFGQSADMAELRAIADANGLRLLTDTAQALGTRHNNAHTGTQADIGGFSFNFHKHIHCGEGGVMVTHDDNLAVRLCRIRNHAESVVKSNEPSVLANMIGYNFRLGELEAAIAYEQLDKLAQQVADRQRVAERLNKALGSLRGVTTPYVAPNSTHSYYVYGLTLDTESIGVQREKIVEALQAEGVPALMPGYINVHRLPLFVNKVAYGQRGFPWSLRADEREFSYGTGTCPVAEELQDRSFLGLSICLFRLSNEEVDLVIEAFHKVWGHLGSLPRA